MQIAPLQEETACATLPAQHTIRFKIRNTDLKDPYRNVEVHASKEELEFFAREGYLIKERMFQGEALERLCKALDSLADKNIKRRDEGLGDWGLFVRHLVDRHPEFLALIKYPPLLSVMRAMLGPAVRLRGSTARVAYPRPESGKSHETTWHFHQRVIPDPVPPFFMFPHIVDALIYLDETNDANGPLCVVPGSHRWTDRDLPGNLKGDLPGQLVLRVPPGTCVFTHGSLWHRGMPTRPEGSVRRMFIMGYGPSWMVPAIYGDKPKDGLTERLLPDADDEMRELLGYSGYM